MAADTDVANAPEAVACPLCSSPAGFPCVDWLTLDVVPHSHGLRQLVALGHRMVRVVQRAGDEVVAAYAGEYPRRTW